MRNERPSRILLVDDDAEMRALAAAALASGGFAITQAGSGMEAFELLSQEVFDLVILDVLMPAITGLEVLQTLRDRSASTAVMIVSGLGSEENRVRGLQLGADDYVTKPYSPREFLARVQALLRRTGATPAPAHQIITLEGLVIDVDGREVWVHGRAVELTAREFDLLAFLASQPGRVFTRDQILREVWQSSAEWQQDGTITEHVRRLRAKIEPDRDHPGWIHTIRGVGYRFDGRTAAEPAVNGAPGG